MHLADKKLDVQNVTIHTEDYHWPENVSKCKEQVEDYMATIRVEWKNPDVEVI